MPRERHEGQGDSVIGSQSDRAVMDLALSVHGAVLRHYRFGDDELIWFSAELHRLLVMPGADESALRARLCELPDPLLVSAVRAPSWQDLQLEQSLEAPDGVPTGSAFARARSGKTRP